MKLPFGMRMAQVLFRKEGFKRKKMTAAFVRGGTLVVCENIFKSHPDSQARENRIHCEHAVLRHVEDGSGGKVYVYRENALGEFALARPCISCWAILSQKGIKKVAYTTDHGFAIETV
jgi:deoxycytidylate deaminase